MNKFFRYILLLLFSLPLFSCKEKTVTITFEPLGGALVESLTLTVDEGSSIDLENYIPTKDHYTFINWYMDNDESKVVTSETKITSDVMFYAKWEANTYTVTYYDFDGVLDYQIDKVYPSTLGVYQPESREGYIFEGWYLEESLTTLVESTHDVSSHMSLYPKWTLDLPDNLTLSFDSQGGPVVNQIVIPYNTALSSIPSVSKTGYTFLGWSIDSENIFDFDDLITEDMSFVALWEQDIYTVTFESMGGTQIESQTYTYDELFQLPTEPRKANYEFVEWLYQEQPFENNTPITSSITLYASWQKIYNETEQYNTYALNFEGFNIHQIQNESSIKFAQLITDTLYKLDFDWDLAIELGYAEFIGDFNQESLLPVNYRSSMALGDPLLVDDYGFVWDISIKDGLMFEDETVIDAYTFEYSWKELLSPYLLNAQAQYLIKPYYLPLVNASAYNAQNQPDTDSLGFLAYTLSDVQYTRENSHYGQTSGGFDIYHVENKYETLIGPDGIKAYVEFWGYGYVAYGQDGWVLETENDEYFRIGTDNNLYAPTTGWTLNGNPVLAVTELPFGVTIKTGGAGYAGALPAYMDDLGNRLPVDENGMPIEGHLTYVQNQETPWSEVGFEVLDDQTFRITLETPVNQNHIKRMLSNIALSVVHPEGYEDGKELLVTETNYGSSIDHTYSFGPYVLSSWVQDELLVLDRQYNTHFTDESYLLSSIKVHLIENQNDVYNLYIDGTVDETFLTGANFLNHQEDENLKHAEQSTLFYFSLNTDYGRDGLSDNDNPFLQYEAMRYALYFGFDRYAYATEARALSAPQMGLLSSIYFSHIDSNQTYRKSEQGQEVLEDFDPDTWGYNPDRALAYFNQAYAQAVTDGLILDGEKITITFTHQEVHTGFNRNLYIKTAYETVFGTDKFELILEPAINLASRMENYTYDIVISALVGYHNNSLQYIQTLHHLAAMVTPFENIPPLEISIELPTLRSMLVQWQNELSLIDIKSPYEIQRFELIESILNQFDGNVYTDDLSNLYNDVYDDLLSHVDYDGRMHDLDTITSVVESAILELMLVIPLHSTYEATLYRDYIGFLYESYNARIGVGEYQYMYIKA